MHDKNIKDVIKTLTRFLTGNLLKTGLDGYVIGLSGGIDSAVSAALAVKAVGQEKVFGIMMPYKTSSENSVTDAQELIKQLGIEHTLIEISPMIDIYFDKIDDSNKLRAGNKMARERMSIVLDFAHKMNRLVLGTGNRTEIALGYTTLFGDSACSVNPLGELYKTDVRAVAKELTIPESIQVKAPSADLWSGQTDESEIGVTYAEIDKLLVELLDNSNFSMASLSAKGFTTTDISRVVSLINLNSFKRNLPPIAPLGKSEIPDKIQLQE